MGELHAPSAIDQAHPSEVVDDGAVSFHADERVVPQRRLVAVHRLEETSMAGAAQHLFHLPRMAPRVVDAPQVGNAGVDHRPAIRFRQQRQPAQPVGQFKAIRRRQHILERIPRAMRMAAVDHRQKVQIVVAQNAHEALAESAGEAQRGK